MYRIHDIKGWIDFWHCFPSKGIKKEQVQIQYRIMELNIHESDMSLFNGLESKTYVVFLLPLFPSRINREARRRPEQKNKTQRRKKRRKTKKNRQTNPIILLVGLDYKYSSPPKFLESNNNNK